MCGCINNFIVGSYELAYLFSCWSVSVSHQHAHQFRFQMHINSKRWFYVIPLNLILLIDSMLDCGLSELGLFLNCRPWWFLSKHWLVAEGVLDLFGHCTWLFWAFGISPLLIQWYLDLLHIWEKKISLIGRDHLVEFYLILSPFSLPYHLL
jgi:hypothetical protein